jgi:hypothetical protein
VGDKIPSVFEQLKQRAKHTGDAGLRKALLAYCNRDTEAMVRIFDALL